MKRASVLIADDHSLVVEGFRKLLEKDFDIIGVVDNGRELVQAAKKLQPDLVLLDISMPLLNGIDAARQIKSILPKVKIIFLTMHGDPTYAAEAVRAGGDAYVLKRSAVSELELAIAEVRKGRSYITPLVTKSILDPTDKPIQSPIAKLMSHGLTSRQREVLQLVAEGHSTKVIADLLNVSVKTIEFHKAGIMQRLGIRTTAELTRYAITHGIVSG
jgi:DNA-binding NarL/FixJ family response regulator